MIIGVDGKSIAGVSSEVSTSRIRGPIGTQVELTIKPSGRRQASAGDLKRASVRIPAVDARMMRDRRRRQGRLRRLRDLQLGRPRRASRRDRAAFTGAARRGSCSTCAATAAACSTRRCSARASSSTRARTSSRPAAAPRAIRTTRRSGDPIEPASDRRPRQPRHGLRGGDPDRGAQGERPRDRRRHAHLRQGRLPGGDGPAGGGALDLTIGQYLTSDGTSILGVGVKPNVRVEDDPATGRRRRGARQGARRSSATRIGRPTRPLTRASSPSSGGAGAFWSSSRCSSAAQQLGSGGRAAGFAAARWSLVERRGTRARVLTELGDPTSARDVVRGADLPSAPARAAASTPRSRPRRREVARRRRAIDPTRRDLTALDTFTVDPVTARDFDDAVSASPRTATAIRLWIHIADVAAHVRPETTLDAEARAPRQQRLRARRPSSRCCRRRSRPRPAASSRASERLAVTAEILLGADGATRSASFYRSRIRSDHRLSYDELDRYFAGRERPPDLIAEPLELARRAAAALRERRRGTERARGLDRRARVRVRRRWQRHPAPSRSSRRRRTG